MGICPCIFLVCDNSERTEASLRANSSSDDCFSDLGFRYWRRPSRIMAVVRNTSIHPFDGVDVRHRCVWAYSTPTRGIALPIVILARGYGHLRGTALLFRPSARWDFLKSSLATWTFSWDRDATFPSANVRREIDAVLLSTRIRKPTLRSQQFARDRQQMRRNSKGVFPNSHSVPTACRLALAQFINWQAYLCPFGEQYFISPRQNYSGGRRGCVERRIWNSACFLRCATWRCVGATPRRIGRAL
jgi:hypothetical protein